MTFGDKEYFCKNRRWQYENKEHTTTKKLRSVSGKPHCDGMNILNRPFWPLHKEMRIYSTLEPTQRQLSVSLSYTWVQVAQWCLLSSISQIMLLKVFFYKLATSYNPLKNSTNDIPEDSPQKINCWGYNCNLMFLPWVPCQVSWWTSLLRGIWTHR